VYTASGFRNTANSVGERRLTSNETVTVERRGIWCKIAKKAISDSRVAPTPKPELEIWLKQHMWWELGPI